MFILFLSYGLKQHDMYQLKKKLITKQLVDSISRSMTSISFLNNLKNDDEFDIILYNLFC